MHPEHEGEESSVLLQNRAPWQAFVNTMMNSNVLEQSRMTSFCEHDDEQ